MDHQLTVEMDLFCFDANQEVKIYFFVKMLWFMEFWGIFKNNFGQLKPFPWLFPHRCCKSQNLN
jgi:hypothetical protein